MKFSLILCTVGRFDEVDRVLCSINAQTYKDFEIIVVDQNENSGVKNIVEKYKNSMNIKYYNVNFKGLSRARNFGLKYAEGDIIGLPDDDCVYEIDVLKNLSNIFAYHNVDVVTGKSVNLSSKIENYNKNDYFVQLNRVNVWKKSISYTIFFKKSFFEVVGLFDITLGVGSGTQYGSGEETDILLTGMEKGLKMIHFEKLCFRHPENDFSNNSLADKFYKYSYGRMHVIKKHQYSMVFVYANIIWPLIKMIAYSFDSRKRKVFYSQFLGRWDYYRSEY